MGRLKDFTGEGMLDQKTNPLSHVNPVNQRDLVPLAVATIALAIMLGTAIMTIFLLLNRSMVQDLPLDPAARPDVYQPAATMLLVGVLAALIVPMVTAWALLSPIEVSYRRFGFAMVSGLGAIVVSILAVPANEFLGIRGLIAMLVISLVICLFLARKVRAERAAL